VTTVTGTLTEPAGLVTFYLVDQDGRRLHDAFVNGGTIVGEQYVELTAGAYTVTLPGNADIQANATANYWVRSFGLSQRRLDVPVSGSWDELQVAADPPPASPDPTATNLITSSTITSAVTGLVTVAFPPVFPTITGIMVTVPDRATSVKLEGCAPVFCPVTSNITVGALIVNNGTSQSVAADYHSLPTATLPATFRPFAVLPPHSSGDYVLKLYSFTNCTLTCDAQTGQPAGIWAYAV
jgi:hypothetical protein